MDLYRVKVRERRLAFRSQSSCLEIIYWNDPRYSIFHISKEVAVDIHIASLLSRHARYRPNHLAVVFENIRLNYDQFNRRVNRLANALHGIGIEKGDKIATILGNNLELLEIYWAGAKIGAVVVPLSPLLRGGGLSSLLHDSDAVVVFSDSNFVEILDLLKPELPKISSERYILTDDVDMSGYQSYRALTEGSSELEPEGMEIRGEDPYNIIYTSGTTGMPKGIVLSHFARAMYSLIYASAYRITPESVILHTGSLVFNGAFLTLMPAFYMGATYILHRNFSSEALIKTVDREKVTHIQMVPSQIVALLNSPSFSAKALQSLEMIGSVGAPLYLEHKQALNRQLPGRFYELYGLTEGFMTILDKEDYAAKPDSVGAPPPFYEMRIVNDQGQEVPVGEVGEITGRSPQLMSGYYKRPDLTDQAISAGWLYSGDLGYVDEDGFLFLVDRKKDMIISGGVNVFPRDIEEIIVKHPDVGEVAVFGVPSEKWGETPLAAVILKETGAVRAEELRDWINERVEARYQRVHAVVMKEDFPRSAAGKTLKRVMREEYWVDRDTRI